MPKGREDNRPGRKRVRNNRRKNLNSNPFGDFLYSKKQRRKMLIPNNHTNSEGDIVFELTHISENKKELKKQIYDRKQYKNWITVNPINNEIVKSECECEDFIINKARMQPCKHLIETINLIKTIIK
jgi:predicted nucleic acid-binding Zn finger protein